ncbi:MAG: C2H2-type zinc finger protein [Actinomycetota bacterium]
MDVFQCPECELKFRFASELEWHMATDHPDFHVEPKSQEASLLSAAHRRRHVRRGSGDSTP